ncbi:MAG: histidinol dehydrogenase [Clostridiales Family XIII bacterium]|jgi:histidinol dehydrogenase|nr:histidinol dehydrogenase [Clostridiales Family XIII bacterium]
MIKIINADRKTEYDALDSISNRDEGVGSDVTTAVTEIIDAVRTRGDEAVREYTIQFDGSAPDNIVVTKEEMKEAFESIDSELRQALLNAASNIKAYHKKQLQRGYEDKREDGCVLGQMIRGLTRVGLYVPGGTAAYPSTVLMNAIPAKIAGVEELIMVSPPRDKNPVILAAAFIAGVDKVLLVGGAQAVAALAYGTETIPKVDKIVGPGNIFVATAKRLVYGRVDIDMIAGPSEILIIADEEANPAYVAADLLSQAEHDKEAASILVTTSTKLAEAVSIEVEKQLAKLSRVDFARVSIDNNGLIIICRSEEEMVRIANYVAPEHLELLVFDPMRLIPDIKNAGSIFAGPWSPEPLGDYYSGTNHVLPTSGTARWASPLGVYDFIKRTSYTYYTKDALKAAKDDIVKIGTSEGLTAHVNAVKIRFE